MDVQPPHMVAIALACLGLGLIVAAFAGAASGATRLVAGLALIVIAFIVSGLQLLLRHGASTKFDQEGT